jgi:hypothetical protein
MDHSHEAVVESLPNRTKIPHSIGASTIYARSSITARDQSNFAHAQSPPYQFLEANRRRNSLISQETTRKRTSPARSEMNSRDAGGVVVLQHPSRAKPGTTRRMRYDVGHGAKRHRQVRIHNFRTYATRFCTTRQGNRQEVRLECMSCEDTRMRVRVPFEASTPLRFEGGPARVVAGAQAAMHKRGLWALMRRSRHM